MPISWGPSGLVQVEGMESVTEVVVGVACSGVVGPKPQLVAMPMPAASAGVGTVLSLRLSTTRLPLSSRRTTNQVLAGSFSIASTSLMLTPAVTERPTRRHDRRNLC